MREFRRSSRAWVLTITWLILFIGVGLIVAESIGHIIGISQNVLDMIIGIWILYFIVCMILSAAFPEDFEYYVSKEDNILIFDFSEYDHRVICTPFWILSKNRKIIVISDGRARIPIQYNKSVLRFLNQYVIKENMEEKVQNIKPEK